MKLDTKIVLFILSFILIIVSIFLLIQYPESGRWSMFAGMFTAIGFGLNIAAFILSYDKEKVKS